MDQSSQIKLYLDEDAMGSSLKSALRSRNVQVITVADAGLTARSDDDQLIFATTNACVLYSYNVGDFCRLHKHWLSIGKFHAGMIVAQQQRFSVGEQLRRIQLLILALPADQMRDRLEFLADWG